MSNVLIPSSVSQRLFITSYFKDYENKISKKLEMQILQKDLIKLGFNELPRLELVRMGLDGMTASFEVQKIGNTFLLKDDKNETACRDFLEAIEKNFNWQKHGCSGKLQHSFDVEDLTRTSMLNTNQFNEENIEIGRAAGLSHDIGRAEQLFKTGTFSDSDSFFRRRKLITAGIYDHGDLGKYLLLENQRQLLRQFIPDTAIYDNVICDAVAYHVKKQLPERLQEPFSSNEKTFFDYGVSELIKMGKMFEVNKYTEYLIRIIQDVDQLDIYRQIIRKDFKPILSDLAEDQATIEAYNLFLSGKYINRADLSKWTCNTGQLIRWSFIYKTMLVSTLKTIKDQKMLETMWEESLNRFNTESTGKNGSTLKLLDLQLGYEFIIALRDALIKTTSDGLFVNKDMAFKEPSVQKIITKYK
ncbi:MAG: HD domain-containing protein [Bacilli bacterium]